MSGFPSPRRQIQPDLVQLLPQGPASIFRFGSEYKKVNLWLFSRSHILKSQIPRVLLSKLKFVKDYLQYVDHIKRYRESSLN